MTFRIGTKDFRKREVTEETGMTNAKGTEVSAFLVQNVGHIIYSATIVIKRVILLKCAGQW